MKGIADFGLPISDWRFAEKTGVVGRAPQEGYSRLPTEQSEIGNRKSEITKWKRYSKTFTTASEIC